MSLINTPGTIQTVVALPTHAAADVTLVHPLLQAHPDKSIVIERVTVIYSTAITGADANHDNLNLQKRTTANAADTELAHKDFGTGTDALQDAVEVLYDTETTLTAGQILAVEIEKVGGGVILGCLTFIVEWRFV